MPGPTTQQLSHETEVLRGDVAGLKQDVASLQITMVKEIHGVREDLHREVQSIGSTLQQIGQNLAAFQARTESVVAQFQAEFPAVRDGLNKLTTSFDGFVKHVDRFEENVKWVHRFLLTWAAGSLVACAGMVWFVARLHSDVEHNTAQIRALTESVKATSEDIKELAAGLREQARAIDTLGKRVEAMAGRVARREGTPRAAAPARRVVAYTMSLGGENLTDPVKTLLQSELGPGLPCLSLAASKKDYRTEDVVDVSKAQAEILKHENIIKRDYKIRDIVFSGDGLPTLMERSEVDDPTGIIVTLYFDKDKERDDLKAALEHGARLTLKLIRRLPDAN